MPDIDIAAVFDGKLIAVADARLLPVEAQRSLRLQRVGHRALLVRITFSSGGSEVGRKLAADAALFRVAEARTKSRRGAVAKGLDISLIVRDIKPVLLDILVCLIELAAIHGLGAVLGKIPRLEVVDRRAAAASKSDLIFRVAVIFDGAFVALLEFGISPLILVISP